MYLQLTKKVEIEETNATFGILLNSSAESTSIKLKQEEAHMNIKGGGNLTIDTDKNITSLSIGDVTVSHQEDLHVAIKQNLTSFELESLNLFGQSTFGSSIENTDSPTKVNSITVFEGAETKMSNLEVTSNVDIETGSTIELDNVDFSSVEMSIALEESGQAYSTLTGKISDPPNSLSFKVVKNNAASILEEKVFYIISSPEENFKNCDDWKNHVSLDGTDYNSVQCKVENGNQVLFASTEKEKSKSWLTLPIFIGIVCGAVVIIVVIIVVIVVVVKKKKRIHSSDVHQETNNNGNDEDDKFVL